MSMSIQDSLPAESRVKLLVTDVTYDQNNEMNGG